MSLMSTQTRITSSFPWVWPTDNVSQNLKILITLFYKRSPKRTEENLRHVQTSCHFKTAMRLFLFKTNIFLKAFLYVRKMVRMHAEGITKDNVWKQVEFAKRIICLVIIVYVWWFNYTFWAKKIIMTVKNI